MKSLSARIGGSTAKAERPEEAKQVEHLEEEGNAMQLEGEETHGQAWAWTMPT